MSIFKKALALLLVIALTAAIAVNVTLAYLVDEKSDVNVMTLGNVEIEQIEQERDGNGGLKTFSQAKPAYPAVGPVEWANTGVVVNGTEYKVFTDGLKNVVDKIVTVNNVGKSNAYIRTVVAIEAPGYDAEDYIHINYNGTDVTISEPVKATIDNTEYLIFVFTYKEALAPEQKSAPSLVQLFLDSKADNEYCAKFGPSWEVLVVSQAVQTNGFSDAATALNTAFGAITENSHPWTNTVLVDSNNEAELMNALTSSKNVIVNTDIVEIDDATFNGKGTKVTLAGVGDGSYGYLAFVPGASNNTKVENLTVTGSGFVEVGHYGEGGGTYTVANLTVKDMNATLTAVNGTDKIAAAFAHYGYASLTNCVMTGTTTAANGYTAYDAGFVNNTKTTINGGEYGSIYVFNHANVRIDGAKINKIHSSAVKLKSGNGALVIGATAQVDVIEITKVIHNGSTLTPALVIEDGAKVGSIIYDGNTYTVEAWNNYVKSL